MNADPDVMRYFQKPLTREESDRFIDKSNQILTEKGFGLWAVEVKGTGRFIGYIGLAVPAFEAHFTPCTEIGWRLSKQNWGQGFATEGAEKVLTYAFQQLGLKEVVSFTSTLNTPSIKVMKRIGMQRKEDEDFDHPKVEKGHRLARHVLFRLENSPATKM
jgi:RimJ/RimL family protein N-acetyltransferase